MVLRKPGNTVGPVRLNAGSAGSFFAGVQDISIIGIGLTVEREYPAGSSFVIEAGPKGWKLPNTLKAELRNATQQADGHWLLGCVFSRPLTADDVEALG
jgi:hypothetical protein